MRYRVTFIDTRFPDITIEADDIHFSGREGGIMFMQRMPSDPVRDQWGGLSAGPSRLTCKAVATNVLMVIPIEADD